MDATIPNEVDDSVIKRRKATAERVARHKRRRRERALIFQIEVCGEDIDALVQIGALEAAQRHDADAVRKAVMALSGEGFQARRAAASNKP